jgi:hypothetical protein
MTGTWFRNIGIINAYHNVTLVTYSGLLCYDPIRSLRQWKYLWTSSSFVSLVLGGHTVTV